VVTATTWGKPPKRSSPRLQRNPPRCVNADAYAEKLLEFREWCVEHDLEFKAGVVQAVERLMSENP
jgi:hypothetical protein